MTLRLNSEYKQKYDFKDDFIKWTKNAVFGKTMENVRKQRDIKLVAIKKKITKLVSEPNYHTTKYLLENILGFATKWK